MKKLKSKKNIAAFIDARKLAKRNDLNLSFSDLLNKFIVAYPDEFFNKIGLSYQNYKSFWTLKDAIEFLNDANEIKLFKIEQNAMLKKKNYNGLSGIKKRNYFIVTNY